MALFGRIVLSHVLTAKQQHRTHSKGILSYRDCFGTGLHEAGQPPTQHSSLACEPKLRLIMSYAQIWSDINKFLGLL